jgi:predicted ATP-grasp superfamily ATP-dependent carboligase
MDASARPPVVVLGLSATGLAVGRIFSDRGIKVYGTDRETGRIGRYSKHIHKPPFGYLAKEASLLDDLVVFSKKIGAKPVLIPADDDFIDFITSNADELKRHYLFQSSYEKGKTEQFLNKKHFYKLCEQHGIAVPKSLYLNGDETIGHIISQIRFPFIIKPDLIHIWKKRLHGKKVVLVQSAEEFKTIVDRYDGILAQSTIQEVIPGPESNIYIFKGYFSEATGVCIADFTGQKIRQVPMDFGSGSFAVAKENEEIRNASINFLISSGFRGLCGSEFKFDDRDGMYKMIEVNIRPQLWEDLTRVAHRDVLWYAYSDLVGLPYEPQCPQNNGATWSYLLRDVATPVHYMKTTGRSIHDWIGPYLSLSTDAVLDVKDPFVSFAAPYLTVSQVVNYLRGR